MNENIPPYLVMDTCCFSNYYKTKEEREEDKENIHFDYDALTEYCKKEGVRMNRKTMVEARFPTSS
ncbi:MAG: hypothetical protein IKZ61_02185 [Prevotella sp.]|nr:hypothetical protein [Prevotella sp.]